MYFNTNIVDDEEQKYGGVGVGVISDLDLEGNINFDLI